jgi:hypothetical protein
MMKSIYPTPEKMCNDAFFFGSGCRSEKLFSLKTRVKSTVMAECEWWQQKLNFILKGSSRKSNESYIQVMTDDIEKLFSNI